MGSLALPAYSLRVQLFSPTAHSLDDKPQRNFRVVTSPELTVREFCKEASRIHEINYGYPLAIKKVQDDQAFDVTQNEILGRLFSTSSIIRVVEALHPSVRDSLPPSSALRFNPPYRRKRERQCFSELNGHVSLWGSSKRPKFNDTDPNHPRPSCESNIDSSNGYPSQSHMIDILNAHDNSRTYYSRKLSLQISETPEPVHLSNKQILKEPLDNSLEIRQDVTSSHEYEPELSSLKALENIKRKDFDEISVNTKNPSQQSNQIDLPGTQIHFSPSSSTSLAPTTEDDSISADKKKKIGENPGRQSSIKSSSVHNETFDIKELVSQESPSAVRSDNSGNTQKDYNSLPHNQKLPLAADKNPLNNEMELNVTSQNPLESQTGNLALEIKNIEKSQFEITEETGSERILAYSSEIVKNTITEKAENLKIKTTKRKSLENSSMSQNLIKPSAKNQSSKAERFEKKNQNILQMSNTREENSSQEETTMSQLDHSPIFRNGDTEAKRSFNSISSSKKPERDFKHSPTPVPIRNRQSPSSSLISASQTPNSSSHTTPGNETQNPSQKALHESVQKNSSSPAQYPIIDSVTGELVDNTTQSLNNKKVSFLADEKKIVKPQSRIVPNTPTASQDKQVSQKPPKKINSNDSNDNFNPTQQKKSYTPILPPKRLSIPLIPAAVSNDDVKSNSAPITISKTPIVPPTKFNPIVSSNQSQAIQADNPKSKSSHSKEKKSDKSLSQKKKPKKTKSIKKVSDSQSEAVAAVSRSTLKPSSNLEIFSDNERATQKPRLPKSKETSHKAQDKDDIEIEADSDCYRSHNPSERDSRSPIEFHRNAQLVEHKNLSISTPDSSGNDDFGSRASDSSAYYDTLNLETDHEHTNISQQYDGSNANFRNVNDIGKSKDLKGQKSKSNTSILSSNSRALKSSAFSKSIRPPNRQVVTDSLVGSSLNQTQSPPTSAPLRGLMTTPSSDMKKPRFGIGASLSAIHRSGGIPGTPQANSKPNQLKSQPVQLQTDSMSDSDASASNSSSSEDDQGFSSQPNSLNHAFKKDLKAARPLHLNSNSEFDSDSVSVSNSSSDSDDPTNRKERAERDNKNELIAKISGLIKA